MTNIQIKRTRGRPRKYNKEGERQKAFRDRRKAISQGFSDMQTLGNQGFAFTIFGDCVYVCNENDEQFFACKLAEIGKFNFKEFCQKIENPTSI